MLCITGFVFIIVKAIKKDCYNYEGMLDYMFYREEKRRIK